MEKQLGTWLVEEAIFRVLGTRSVTKENVSQLKEKVDMLPADLRNTVIGKFQATRTWLWPISLGLPKFAEDCANSEFAELSHTPCRHCMDVST